MILLKTLSLVLLLIVATLGQPGSIRAVGGDDGTVSPPPIDPEDPVDPVHPVDPRDGG